MPPRSYPSWYFMRTLLDILDYALALYMVLIGATILAFYRTDKEATRSAYGVINWLPGPNAVWGAFALVFGAMLLTGAITGRRRWLFWGAFCAGSWCVLFSFGFIILAINNDGAGTIHAMTWMMFAVLYCIWAVARSRRFEDL